MRTQKTLFQLILVFVFSLLGSGCTANNSSIATIPPTSEPIIAATETPEAIETSITDVSDEHYSQPSVDICPMMQQMANEVLGVEVMLENNAPFMDITRGETGEACRLSAKSEGTDYENASLVVKSLVDTLGLGWTEQLNYQADGPTGSSTALTRDWTIMVISAGWQPKEMAVCSVDQPVSECDLSADQKEYIILIEISEYHPDFTLDGHWVEETSGFTLDLYQDWTTMYGQHLIVAQNGEKIDSLEASINGNLVGKTASVEFLSSFANDVGFAEITWLDDGSIQWKVITPPNGEFYLPAEAILIRTLP